MDALEDTHIESRHAASRLPTYIKFPSLVLVSLSLSAAIHTAFSTVIGHELGSVSRELTEEWQIGAMAAWKLSELAAAWYLRYDYVDLAWLTFLSNVPHYFLLNTFYGIDYVAALIPLAIDVMTIAIPFAIFRGPIHARDSASPKTPNQIVAQDVGIRAVIAAFGAGLYSIVIYSSFYTWLPTYMAVHFEGLKSLVKAHEAVAFLLAGLFLPLGYGATQFIFVPAIGSAANPGLTDPRAEKAVFNPETATFGQTLAYNLGFSPAGLTPRAEILIKRTAVLAASTFVNSLTRSYVTVAGTEFVGAVGWSFIWVVASALTGVAFSWVGDE